MAKPIFSPLWYRVAGLKPRLRSHARIHRHRYRGETWYVLQDQSMERMVRFSPAAHSLVGLMDGTLTVEEIWLRGCDRLGDDAPTQDDFVQLLSQLFRTDVLQCDVAPDVADILQRHEQQQRRQWQSKLFSFLSWRFRLFDPERFLQTLMPLMRPAFSYIGGIIWLAVVLPACVLAATHWTDLTMNLLDQLMAPQNLLLLFFLFPLIKAAHEFGHAFATKAYGGEVHDMGLMLLVMTPVPYVDASAATAFREKGRRMLVGAAGMIVELFIASLALYLWLNAQPGTARTLAYNTVLIAGISTLVFNANPLLRYDGYYILADWLEIPNLRGRANSYLGYLCERYLFGRAEAEVAPASASERAWFVTYGVGSYLYRMFVTVAILFYVAEQLFNLGKVVALVGAGVWLVIPLFKAGKFVLTSPKLRAVRGRASAVTFGGLALLLAVLALVPVPYRTAAEGVVWIPEEAFVRAGAEGFVEKIVARPGAPVKKGDVLALLTDPVLVAQEKVLIARVNELDARQVQYLFSDRVKAETAADERRHALERLADNRRQLADLVIRSGVDGTFVVPAADDLPGQFVKKGELLGYVLQFGTVTVRTIIPQGDIDLVQHRTVAIDVRLSEQLGRIVPGVLRRLVPAASERLPAPALGGAGGGQVPVDPSDREGVTAVQKVFQVDIELPSDMRVINLGGRGYVRFDHGTAPLAAQWYRTLRQLFLARFHV